VKNWHASGITKGDRSRRDGHLQADWDDFVRPVLEGMRNTFRCIEVSRLPPDLLVPVITIICAFMNATNPLRLQGTEAGFRRQVPVSQDPGSREVRQLPLIHRPHDWPCELSPETQQEWLMTAAIPTVFQSDAHPQDGST
jgi:hypothetical protein